MNMIITTIRGLGIVIGTTLTSFAWAHPYGHHPQGDVVLAPHAHAEALASWPLAAGILLAGCALHWLGRRVGGRAGRVVHIAGIGLTSGGALLLLV